MAAVAPASKTLLYKNILMILLFLVFLVWFGYDGWIGWPKRNDGIVATLATKLKDDITVSRAYYNALASWKGWHAESPESRAAMADHLKKNFHDAGWKTDFDLQVQKYISFGLVFAVLWSVWRAVQYARRRALADDAGLIVDQLPIIPWDAITQVDNRRWKKSGIVTLTYRTPSGGTGQVDLDDYILDHESLIPVLDQLATRAEKAEFLNPETPTPPAPTP